MSVHETSSDVGSIRRFLKHLCPVMCYPDQYRRPLTTMAGVLVVVVPVQNPGQSNEILGCTRAQTARSRVCLVDTQSDWMTTFSQGADKLFHLLQRDTPGRARRVFCKSDRKLPYSEGDKVTSVSKASRRRTTCQAAVAGGPEAWGRRGALKWHRTCLIACEAEHDLCTDVCVCTTSVRRAACQE
jgi:hypothetical protein